MAIQNIISLSELEGLNRIDAEYYQPDYLSLIQKLVLSGAVLLKKVVFTAKRKFQPKANEYFNYIEIAKVDLSSGEFNTSIILGKNAPDRAQWIVKKNDVLVSTVRPIRNAVTLIRCERDNLVCSSGFAVLQPRNISPEYVFLYLKSNFIAHLLDRYTTSTEYPAISWNDILNIPIYIGDKLFRKNISEYVDKAFVLLKESKSFYSQAENLLLEELGLKDFKIKFKHSYTANLSQAVRVHRIDAEHFQPAYEEMVEKTSKKLSIFPLRKIFDFKRGVFIPTEYYSEKKTKRSYIRIKELSGRIGIDESKIIFINDYYSEDKINELKENDLVIAIIGDTIGKTNKISKELSRGFCSNNIGRLRIKEGWINKILPEFAEILFQSFFIQSQIEKKKAQTGQPKISNNEIKEIKIPLVPPQTQQKIALLVKQSHKERRKSKEIFEEAKRKIEEVIEYGINKL